MGREIHYRSIAWDILKALGYGAIVASLFVAPNIGMALAPFLEEDEEDDGRARREWERERVRRALERLEKRRYIQYEERGKETYIIITEEGKQRLRKFAFHELEMPEKPRRWDGKWRLVIFDIPEKRERERKLLRDKLRELGFFALQKSVFAYPYSCEDELDFITRFLDIDRYVHCIRADDLGSAEGTARRVFRLL